MENKKGEANVVEGIPTVIVLVLMLAVGAIILNEISTSFDDEFGLNATGVTCNSSVSGDCSAYQAMWNNTSDNAVTGINMMTVVIILVSAGILITAVFAFAGRG